MPINVKVVLQGPDGSPLYLAARLVYTEVDGDRVTLAEGATDKAGFLGLTCELPRGGKTILPDLVLEDPAGRRLAASGRLDGTTLSFGVVVVLETPVATVEGVSWIGLPAPVAALSDTAGTKAALERAAAAEKALASAKGRIEATEKELAAATARLTTMDKELAAATAQATVQADRAEALAAELLVATSRHDAVATDRAQVAAQLAATEGKLAHALETNTVYQTGEARLEYVVRAIGSQLEDARTTLDQSGSRYKVNKVSATLRVVPDKTGALFSFPAPESVTDSKALSELVIELEETAPPAPAPVAPALVVPRLSGLTRVAVERVLRKAGLTPAFVSETVRDPADVGRCVRQSPLAAAPTTPGAVVAVYLGKLLGSAS